MLLNPWFYVGILTVLAGICNALIVLFSKDYKDARLFTLGVLLSASILSSGVFVLRHLQ